jgi:hypothetical protein
MMWKKFQCCNTNETLYRKVHHKTNDHKHSWLDIDQAMHRIVQQKGQQDGQHFGPDSMMSPMPTARMMHELHASTS